MTSARPRGRALALSLVVFAAAAAAALIVRPDSGPARALVAPAEAQFRVRTIRPAPDGRYNFYFTRGAFSGSRRSWSTDAPQADRWIASVINRLTAIEVSPYENYVALDDPELRNYPFVYILEVGGMRLRESEVEGLRSYLLQGGFVMVDDFWGSWEWSNWEREIMRVLPEFEIVDVPLTHEIFSMVYAVDEVVQVPGVQQAQSGYTGQRDGDVPVVRGIFDDDGRLMVVINWNTDLGDAWEWAEAMYYPLHYSTYAYQVAANTFMYALTH